MPYLIAGLGTPDKKYEHTRHNAGFDALDYLAEKYDIRIREKKFKGLIGTGRIEGFPVILLKPLTYMNLSGESIQACMDYYDIPVENLVVISDDIHLDVGSIRVRGNGSAGGHNGLKNIISHLGTQDFKRIRVGVGRMPENEDQIRYVLSGFSKQERTVLEESLKDAGDAAVTALFVGTDAAMNRFTGKKNL